MLNILDLPPELLRTIFDLILDSTRPIDRQTAQVRFLRTCRIFRAIADGRICLDIWDASALVSFGEIVEDWDSERCKAVELVVLEDVMGYSEALEKHSTPLRKLRNLQSLLVSVEYWRKGVDFQMLIRIFGSFTTLTTLNLDHTSSNQTEVDVGDVLDYLTHLPHLQSLTLPFVSFKSTITSYAFPPHPLISLKISLRGLRGCDYFAALFPALPNLRSLFLGVLPATGYDDSVPLEHIEEFDYSFDYDVIERLAAVIDKNGAKLTTSGFGAVLPYGCWYSSNFSELVKIYDVLPTSLEHILVTPHGLQLSELLHYLSDYFPQLRHLTLTSETLSDREENRQILSGSDLNHLMRLCERAPLLEVLTFKEVGMYYPEHNRSRWHTDPSREWSEMECQVKAMGKVIEYVGREGYQEE